MDKEALNNIRIILQEELEPVKSDLSDIKQKQRQLSKDITVSLGKYHHKLVGYVGDRTEVLNKRVYKLEAEMEQIIRR